MRPAFIVNPEARRGLGRRAIRLIRELDPGAHVVTTRGPRDAIALAATAVGEGFDPIVAVGGDGTVNEVLNGVMGASGGVGAAERPRLGVVPVGTGNDFVRSLRLPRARDAVSLALGRVPAVDRVVDAARCNDRWFIGVAGAGFDARVARAAADAPRWLRIGPAAFVWHTLREIVGNRNVELTVTLAGPDGPQTVTQRSLLVAVANCRYSGSGMQLAPGAVPDDGLLDVCLVGDATRAEVVRMLPTVFWGGHVRHPKVAIHRATSVVIEGPPAVRGQVDGEAVGGLPLEFALERAALRVLVPVA